MKSLLTIFESFFKKQDVNILREAGLILGKRAFRNSKKLDIDSLLKLLIQNPISSLQAEIIRNSFIVGLHTSEIFSKQSLIQSRKYLHPEFFKYQFEKLTNLIDDNSQFRLYKNDYLLVGADGSTLKMPKTKAIKEKIGSVKNQHGEQSIARTEFIFDLMTGYCLGGHLGRSNSGELDMLLQGLELLKAIQTAKKYKVILVLDRLYSSIGLIMLLKSLKIHFLIRCRKNWNKPTKDFMETNAEEEELNITLSGRAQQQLVEWNVEFNKKEKVKVRVLRFKLKSGEDEILITDLNHLDFSRAEIFEIYSKRWCVETGIGIIKNLLRMECYTGHSPDFVEQDYHATLIEYNLTNLVCNYLDDELQKLDKDKNLKHERQINRALVTNIFLRMIMPKIKTDMTEQKLQEVLSGLQVLLRFPEVIRKGRSYARKAKRKAQGRWYYDNNFRPAC